jgi:hypothetical protein
MKWHDMSGDGKGYGYEAMTERIIEMKVAEYEVMQRVALANFKGATCAKCGKPIISLEAGDDRWVHASNDRGCRAATFTAAKGWDDSIDRRWLPRPAKGSITAGLGAFAQSLRDRDLTNDD